MRPARKTISLFGSIWRMKCPRCRRGDLFETPTFSFRKPTGMYDRCEVCSQSFIPEPGFYYGAMFISYIWTGWFCLFFVGGGMWFLGLSINVAFLLLLMLLAIFFFWIFRISRSIWIHMMVRYRPEFAARTDSSTP